MQKLIIVSALALLVVLGIAAVTGAGGSPAYSSSVTPVLSSAHVQPPNLSPGVYSASPSSMLVIVPKPVDPRMSIGVSNNFMFNMPCIKPETRLDKR